MNTAFVLSGLLFLVGVAGALRAEPAQRCSRSRHWA
jgi:hypothetical protein